MFTYLYTWVCDVYVYIIIICDETGPFRGAGFIEPIWVAARTADEHVAQENKNSLLRKSKKKLVLLE